MVDLTNIEFYKNSDDNWKEEKINSRITNIPLDFTIKKIQEIAKINYGQRITKKNNIGASLYPVVGSGNESFKTNTYNRENEVTIGRFALSKKCINKHKMKFFLNDSGMTLSSINDNQILLNFLLFHNESIIYNCARGAAQKNMDMKEFANLKFYLPNSLEEQEKIASILETQENLILSKKELLEKYKKQRKYFQQELLSGRIRMKLNNKSMSEAFELGLIKQTFLNDANEVVEYGGDTITNVNIDIIDKDGFENWLSIDFENKIEFYKNIDFKEEKINGRVIRVPNDWDRKLFKDYFISRMGETILNVNLIDNGKIPVYSATEEYKVFGYVNNSKFVLKENDLVIPARGNSIGFIKIINSNSTCTQTTIAASMINNNKYTSKYIFEYLMFLKLKKQIFNIEGGAIPQLTVKEMNDINIFIPNVIEQTLIAKQLTKIDNLIESLEEEIKLENKKFTYLKQELLSGRIRVN